MIMSYYSDSYYSDKYQHIVKLLHSQMKDSKYSAMSKQKHQ